MNFWWFSIFIISCFHDCSSEEVMVTIKQGKLLGLKQKTDNKVVYYSFTNIPYAKPPIGKLRFKPPQEPVQWKGVRVISFTPVCYQWITNFGNSNFFGVEDCLYLNVFTPVLKNDVKLPVLVCIHGGEFQRGSSYECPPNNFIENDIVFVSFNYRLGILGFLSNGDESLSGNYGLKDQVAALQWVKTNIATFSGDPKKITILGQNAGGISVHLHMYSDLSKGLFHSAISQSGTALIPWAITPVEVAKNRTHVVMNEINCLHTSNTEMLNCLTKVQAKSLVELQPKLFLWYYEPNVIFSPTIEFTNTKNTFLTKNPWKDEETNLVPWLLGFNSGEGIFKAASFYAHNKSLIPKLNEEYDVALPITLMYKMTAQPEDSSTITTSLKKFYFQNREINTETIRELINLIGDGLMNYGCMKTVKRYKYTKYVYLFDHLIENSISKIFTSASGIKDLKLVSHGDEFITLFTIPLSQPKNEKVDDTDVSSRMLGYWTNFIKYGNPNNDKQVWDAMKTEEIRYLRITTKNDTMKTGLWEDVYQFWEKLPLRSKRIIVEKDEL